MSRESNPACSEEALSPSKRAKVAPPSPPVSHSDATTVDCEYNSYDYAISTEDCYTRVTNTHLGKAVFVGKYAYERSKLDYSYHKYYRHERQLVHDKIVDAFLQTSMVDEKGSFAVPQFNWIVFTAGAMGVGRLYVCVFVICYVLHATCYMLYVIFIFIVII